MQTTILTSQRRRPEFAAGTVAALGLLLAAAGAASAAPTHEFVLDNGLSLVVHEDHRAPVLVSQIWYRVGSSYEPPGLTGISHVLEHMMFKGTEKYGPGEFSRIIAAHGGRENAFTGRDYTAYFQQLARSELALAFELESDRMRNLALPAQEFATELQVVMEERRLRTEDDPQALALEAARSVAFAANPYRQPVIGWMADLERLSIADLRAWYERWYDPANAVLVVAGDVDPGAVHALARDYFATIPSAGVRAPRAVLEPPQRGPKRARVRAPAQVPLLVIQFQVPTLASVLDGGDPARSWEPYALELLADLLAGDAGARLRRELVRETAVAAQVRADYELYARLPGLFSIHAVPAPGHDSAALEQRLHAALERVRRDGVSEAELARARTRLTTSRLYRQDSVFYQAMEIGVLESVGLGWRTRERYDGALAAVTAEQVRSAARRHLRDEAMTVTVLEPSPAGDQAP